MLVSWEQAPKTRALLLELEAATSAAAAAAAAGASGPYAGPWGELCSQGVKAADAALKVRG